MRPPHNHLSTSSLHILPFHFHGHRDACHTCINSIRNLFLYSLFHFSSRLANSYPNTTPPPASCRILLLPPAPAPLQPASQDRAQTMFLLAPHPLPIIHRAHYHPLLILRHKGCQRSEVYNHIRYCKNATGFRGRPDNTCVFSDRISPAALEELRRRWRRRWQ